MTRASSNPHADLRLAWCHGGAIALVEHPIRQLTAKIRPLLRVHFSSLHRRNGETCNLRLNRECQRYAIVAKRKLYVECRALVGASAEHKDVAREWIATEALLHQQRQPACLCACQYNRWQSRSAHLQQAGSSTPQKLKDLLQCLGVHINAHATAAKFDLDYFGTRAVRRRRR